MNYIYHINGEAREPTTAEWQNIADRFLTMAGFEKSEEKSEYAEQK